MMNWEFRSKTDYEAITGRRSSYPIGVAESFLNPLRVRRLSVTQSLLEAGVDVIVDGIGSRGAVNRKLLIALLIRSTHTLEASLATLQCGRGVQSAMLNRSLFEDALDIHWVFENPSLAPTYAEAHQRLMSLAEAKSLAEFGRHRTLTAAEAEELKELEGECGGYRASWTRASVADRICLVKAAWDAPAASSIEFAYSVMQRQNNTLLHSTPSALSFTVGGRGPNLIGVDAWWDDAIGHSVLAYYLTSRLAGRAFGSDLNVLEILFDRAAEMRSTVSVVRSA